MTTTDAHPATTPPPGSAPPDRLLDRRYLPVVVGVVALVTLAAFENRAVQTVLPVVVRDLDGWALFGASTGASLVTFTVGMALSGGWTDRFGPRPVLLAGIGVFGVAQVVSALAPSMAVFVGGRALSGVAEALIDTTLMVLVAQALPESLRAKVFASFAAAWILPSLLGPGFAGGVESLAGWRWVFAGPLLVVPFALWLLRPALRGDRPAPAPVADEARAPGSRRPSPSRRGWPSRRSRRRCSSLRARGPPAWRPCSPAVSSSSSRPPGPSPAAPHGCAPECRRSSGCGCSPPPRSPASARSSRSCS